MYEVESGESGGGKRRFSSFGGPGAEGHRKMKRIKIDVETTRSSGVSTSSAEQPFTEKLCGMFSMPPMERAIDVVVIFFSELFGTSFLVLLLCSGVLVDVPTKITYSISYGLAMVVVVQIYGHISFCNVNPAISFAAVILGTSKTSEQTLELL